MNRKRLTGMAVVTAAAPAKLRDQVVGGLVGRSSGTPPAGGGGLKL